MIFTFNSKINYYDRLKSISKEYFESGQLFKKTLDANFFNVWYAYCQYSSKLFIVNSNLEYTVVFDVIFINNYGFTINQPTPDKHYNPVRYLFTEFTENQI